ncbi:MAG: putative toxin-antitoxin system toxin component, PIN family [Thermoleophilia bacterium]|nr:putative toxin-antitoxin system toxin component, PIN family [Thermoleophilia bacterium]
MSCWPRPVVFDTNVVLSALLLAGDWSAWLRSAWRQGTITPIVCRATVLELVTALAYPKFGLSSEERDLLLADYLPFAEVIEYEADATGVLARRDPLDQVFLELAARSGADALVTGDQDLLTLKGTCPFELLTPRELLERLAS